MPQIDQVYCEYCKRHEDAVLRLQELESKPDVQLFLNVSDICSLLWRKTRLFLIWLPPQKCRDELQGRTTSWDLGSLLIKPVQRVLKYPLLLRVG